jgi:hypothetical protein
MHLCMRGKRSGSPRGLQVGKFISEWYISHDREEGQSFSSTPSFCEDFPSWKNRDFPHSASMSINGEDLLQTPLKSRGKKTKKRRREWMESAEPLHKQCGSSLIWSGLRCTALLCTGRTVSGWDVEKQRGKMVPALELEHQIVDGELKISHGRGHGCFRLLSLSWLQHRVSYTLPKGE